MSKKGILLGKRHKLIKKLGKGGQGQVWLAEDTHNNNNIEAIKFPLEQYKKEAQFVKEAEQMEKMANVPYIIDILDKGVDAIYGEYYAMTYFPDGSLDQLIDKEGAINQKNGDRYFSLEQALIYLRPVAQALDAAHKMKIHHLDLKPNNILVDKGNKRCVLSDFNRHLGAPEIMSPEQLQHWHDNKGHKLDWQSDLYAFGCCLYKVLTGAYPYTLEAKTLEKKLEEQYDRLINKRIKAPAPVDLNPHHPDLKNQAVNELIQQLVSRSRSNRMSNLKKIEDVVDKLENALKSADVPPKTISLGQRNGMSYLGWLFLSIAIIISVLLCRVGYNETQYAYVTSTPTTPPTPTATETSTATNTPTATATLTLTFTPSVTPTLTPTFTASVTPTPSVTATGTNTVTPTSTATPSPTNTTTATNTAIPLPTATTQVIVGSSPNPVPVSTPCLSGLAITDPPAGSTISDNVTIRGIATHVTFAYYKMEYRPPAGNWTCCIINPTRRQVSGGALGTWTISGYPAGTYDLRLMVVKADGNYDVCDSKITLQK